MYNMIEYSFIFKMHFTKVNVQPVLNYFHQNMMTDIEHHYACISLVSHLQYYSHSGNRLLTATDYLQLWAPPSSDILEEDEDDPDNPMKDDKVLPVLNDWKCVWQCK